MWYTNTRCGEVAEWSKAQHWKCCSGVTRSWVRIPSSPPKQRNTQAVFFLFWYKRDSNPERAFCVKKICRWQVFSKKGASESGAKSGGKADSIPSSPPKENDNFCKKSCRFLLCFSLLFLLFSLLSKENCHFQLKDK